MYVSPIVINRRQGMNFENIFTVRNGDLSRLDEHTAVDFFWRLLWMEARRIGIEISKIMYPTKLMFLITELMRPLMKLKSQQGMR